MSAKLLVRSLLLTPILLTACSSGFEVLKPPVNGIMSIRNDSAVTVMSDPSGFQAHPIPVLPAASAPPMTTAPYRLVPKSVPGTPDGAAPAPAAAGVVYYPDINASPFDRFARLSFNEGGTGYICSSEFVGDSRDVVMTAAHCVFSNDTNSWNSNWQVAPKYNNGTSSPRLDWECVAIYTGWAQKQYPFDYAFIKVRGTSPTALGLRGAAMPATWTSAGYPGLYGSTQRLAAVDGANGGGGGGLVKMSSNPMGKGSSGGAWLENGVAIGLNSFYYSDDTTAMWGPQFDASTIALYEYVRRGCRDEVTAASPASILSANKASVEISAKVAAISPTLVYRDDASCTCKESKLALIANATSSRYMVTYSRISYGDRSPTEKETVNTEILPGETRSLQCTVSSVGSSSSACDGRASFALDSTRRIERTKDITGIMGIKSVTPAHCTEMCADSAPTGYCLPLGSEAQPIMKSLGTFVSDALNRNPTGNVVATVDDMTLAFKGDPSKVGNPCARSSFYRVNDFVSNDGMDCKVTTAPLDPSPQSMRISLATPTQSRAIRIAASGGGSPATSAVFSAKSTSPVLEFSGPSTADTLNALFGGTVVAVQRIDGKLIVTTENGCVKGDE